MDNFTTLFQQAASHYQAGRLIDAVAAYRQVLTRKPALPQAHYNLAIALEGLNRFDEAIASYRNAIAHDPGYAEAHNNLGNLFHNHARLDEARDAYGRALSINPRLTQAQFNLGLVLQKQNQFDLAVRHFQAALAIAPDYAEAFDHLFALLRRLGRIEDWLAAFRQFEQLGNKPDWFFFAGLSVCRYLGDFAREQKYLDAMAAHKFKDGEIEMLHGLLALVQYFDVPQPLLMYLYQAYNALVKRVHVAEFPLVSSFRPQRAKLRIGYLSADFREHVMGKLMLEVLSRHDRTQFEICLYSLSKQEDELSTKFREVADKFVILHGLQARQAARTIAQDDLDILIDLCNHSTGSNPAILAYKPARVQITHLGAHGAIGLDAIDYKLTDRYADTPENSAFQIEKLLTMEGCLFPYRHVDPVTDPRFSRAALGIAQDAVVLGVFTNIVKLSPRCLRAWAAILKRVERAVLAFSPFQDIEQASYLRQVAAAGIDPARVKFIPASKDEQFNRARYALLDIALDTFPYSGGDTSMAALDMAVPLVTLCGQRNAERASFSILMNLGVEQTIARSEAQFVDIACRLANDAAWRAEVVAQIRRGLAGSPLVDIVAHSRNLEAAYRQAVAHCPVVDAQAIENYKALFQEAVRMHQANRIEEAAGRYRKVLEFQSEHVPALYLFGMLLGQSGADEEAIDHLRRATIAGPAYLDAHQALGNLYLKTNRFSDASASFKNALQLNPQHYPALNGMGRALTGVGRLSEAVAVLNQAIGCRPEESTAYFNLGVACQKQGMLENAASAYQRVLALEPDNLDAQFNLAVLYQEHGQNDRAAACYQRVLQLQPDDERMHARTYYQLGGVLAGAGRTAEWLENFQQFRRKLPLSAMLAIYGLRACQHLGEVGQQQAYLAGLLSGELIEADASDELDRLEEMFFLVLYLDFPQRHLLDLYQRYNRLSKQVYSPQKILPPRAAGGKLRIGYLSGDMRDHVMGKMMYQAISHHDTEQFEIYSYSLTVRQDAWTDRYRACSHKFVDLAKLDPESAATRIAEDDLDILVDLSSHTDDGLPAILAYKPARVQITHIASAGAVGLDTIDFKLTDRYADTEDNQQYLLERMLPMDGCVFPYRHIDPSRDHECRRSDLGIAEDAVVIGAFVTLMKLSPRCLALWKRVLDAIPKAVLAFSPMSEQAKAGYLQWVTACGISQDRVLFIPAGKGDAQNQARYAVVDMVLDAMPYGGVNGTLEALDMGVPVVTLCGERHGERTGYSILMNLGVDETIARDEEQYIAIATRLANDRQFRDGVVKRIRHGLVHSTLVDAVGHTRSLEAAYRQALAQIGATSVSDAARFPASDEPQTEVASTASDRTKSELISVIICSINPDKFAKVSKNYAALLRETPFEIIGIHDAKSLCEGYNRGIAQSKGSILIFSHDDIEILTPDFGVRLKNHLQSNDMIGVVGTSRLMHGQWIAAGQPCVHGHVIYFDAARHEYFVNLFGADAEVVSGMQALDGMFFAMTRKLADALKFDEERFDGFHFYDIDYSFSAHRAGYRIAVCNDISIIHDSTGKFDEAWQRYHDRFMEKHGAALAPFDPQPMRAASHRTRSKQEMLTWCAPANLIALTPALRK
ncbi:hypothetical protein BH11PSE11_BH11PSE11_37980 [soil metagenome]